ncbi:MAG TPA: TonB-dependent receptor [Vicinamibacteria bacterium]|nr:TonB-dependent receptor [Vicinamibacteria bacterium]
MRVPFTGVILAAMPAVAGAQAPAPSPSPSPVASHNEYVEVTATRIPESPEEVPASIEVITGQELEDRGATDLRSALSLATGVDIAPGGDAGPAGSVPEFWGLKEFDAFLLVVDGVPWGGAFNPALTTLDLHDLDRIEVLRGAAPVMYGATSFVGVIQVVHKDAGGARRRASLTGGSYTSGGGSFSLPFAWAGFSSTFSADAGKTGFKDDRTEYERGHALWRSSRALGGGRLRFDFDLNLVNQDPASPTPREGPALSPRVPVDANQNPDGAFIDDRRFTIGTGYEKPAAGGDWSTTLSFSRGESHVFRGFLTDLDAAVDNARGIRENVEQRDLYFDTHLSWATSQTLRLVAGLDFLHGEGEAEGADFDYTAPLDGSFAPSVSEPTVLDVGIEDKRSFGGLYGFAEWHPAPAWRLEAGLRLNHTIEEREGEEGGARPPGEEDAGEVTHTRLSGSAGILWTAWEQGQDRLRVFANYRNTFKPAAIDFGIEEGEGEEGEGVLDPETAQSVELGTRVRGFGGHFDLDVSAFLMDFDNLVMATSVNGIPALINGGTQRFKGIETAVSYRVSDFWTARATWSLHDARFRDFVQDFDGVPTQLADKRLEMSAHHLVSAGVRRVPSHGVLGLLEMSYVGSRYLNKRNTALADGYASLSAALGWRDRHWEARVAGTNLGDKRDPVSESELGDAQYYRLYPRRFDVSATLHF